MKLYLYIADPHDYMLMLQCWLHCGHLAQQGERATVYLYMQKQLARYSYPPVISP